MQRIKIIILCAIFTVISGNFFTLSAQAGLDATLRAGVYAEEDDYYVGGGLTLNLFSISLCPNVEYVFIENGDFYTFNMDGHLNLISAPGTAFWIGLGWARLYLNPDKGDSVIDSGMNLLAGFGIRTIPLNPYIQTKYILTDNNQFVIGLGIFW
ncbi:MAG: hypothetical protein EH225_04640 [Calditrichaeota bacterium]|nr:MAG: hypothetical protein EH225_04640 [Calditrichota bacterium]